VGACFGRIVAAASLINDRGDGLQRTAPARRRLTEQFHLDYLWASLARGPRPLQFLEWARNAGLLRVTGIAYQSRHDSYQQWLAAGDVDRGVKTTLDAQAG
jgi:hypothetical protein